MARKSENAVKKFASGLGMCVIAGFFFLRGHSYFWLFILAFAGVLPAVKGLGELIGNRLAAGPSTKRIKAPPKKPLAPESLEKQLLRAARNSEGRLTVASAALQTEAGMDEVQAMLDKMSAKGHVHMDVSPDGRISYVFSEFLPE